MPWTLESHWKSSSNSPFPRTLSPNTRTPSLSWTNCGRTRCSISRRSTSRPWNRCSGQKAWIVGRQICCWLFFCTKNVSLYGADAQLKYVQNLTSKSFASPSQLLTILPGRANVEGILLKCYEPGRRVYIDPHFNPFFELRQTETSLTNRLSFIGAFIFQECCHTCGRSIPGPVPDFFSLDYFFALNTIHPITFLDRI